MTKVGHNHIYLQCIIFLAGKSPNIWSYTVYMYGSGLLYKNTTMALVGK